MWPTRHSMPPRAPWTLWRYPLTWASCHEPPTPRSRRGGAPAWRRLPPALWADPLGRAASSPAGYRAVSHGRPGRPYHPVRPLWARSAGVQLVPPPQLPEMSRCGPSGVAHRPRTRAPGYRLLSWDLYAPARPRVASTPEPALALWAALSHRRADPPRHCWRPQASRSRDRRLRRVAHLGPTTPPSSPSPLCPTW